MLPTSTDRYAGREGCIERWHVKTDEPNEASVSPKLNGAQTESVLSKMNPDSICQCVTVWLRKDVRHVLHDSKIGIETCERLAVGLVPVPEDQALCRESRKHGERLTDLGFIGLQRFTQRTQPQR
jgi:hypothetical protein